MRLLGEQSSIRKKGFITKGEMYRCEMWKGDD